MKQFKVHLNSGQAHIVEAEEFDIEEGRLHLFGWDESRDYIVDVAVFDHWCFVVAVNNYVSVEHDEVF